MILSDVEIRDALARNLIRIEPAPLPDQFATTALDLTVGVGFKRWSERLLAGGLMPAVRRFIPGSS